jgi:hypothetical protein
MRAMIQQQQLRAAPQSRPLQPTQPLSIKSLPGVIPMQNLDNVAISQHDEDALDMMDASPSAKRMTGGKSTLNASNNAENTFSSATKSKTKRASLRLQTVRS